MPDVRANGRRGPLLAILSSAIAGGLGAAIVDVVLAVIRQGQPLPAGGLLWSLVAAGGLYGGVALLAGLVATVVAAGIAAALPARAAARGWDRLRRDEEWDRAVAAGVLAVAVAAAVIVAVVFGFARAFGLEMQNKRNGALSTALVAAAALVPAALAWFPAWAGLRPLARALPRPRTLSGIGLLAIGAALAVAGAVLSVDWRVLDFGPELAVVLMLALAGGHYLVWSRGPAARLWSRLPSGVVLAAQAAGVAAAVLLLAVTMSRFGGEPRSLALVGDETWGARPLLKLARALSDRDHDGYSANLGGGDCDDRDRQRFPGATEVAGNGVDEDCDGADAPAPVEEAAAPAPREEGNAGEAPARPRGDGQGGDGGNLLIITIDTLRADRLDARRMPNLTAFARDATVFSHAYAQAPNTPRSFPSFLTSRFPSRVRWGREWANFAPMADDNLSLFEVLQHAGYYTVGEFSHFYAQPSTGIQQGFDEWHNPAALTLHDSNTDSAAPRITAQVVKRLRALAARKQRFALWTHYFDPHSRYMEHPGFPVSGSGVKALESKYDGEVGFVDQHLAQVFDELKASGLAATTTVVVFADHGESFGEHRMGGQLVYFHGETMFEEVLRVPLVVKVPGQAGRVVDTRVMLVDMAPTVLELAGLEAPASFQGRSLAPATRGQALADRPVYAELLPAPAWNHTQKVLIDGGLKLVNKISDSSAELYDLGADPGEAHNLALTRPQDVARLKDALRAFPPGGAARGGERATTTAAGAR